MGRAGALAIGAILGGLILTLVLVAALDPPAPRASVPPTSGADAPSVLGDTPRRCRTATVADAACAAAWEAKRRHFFGTDKDVK